MVTMEACFCEKGGGVGRKRPVAPSLGERPPAGVHPLYFSPHFSGFTISWFLVCPGG